MGEQQDKPVKRKPFLSTPAGLIAAAVLMWVAAGLLVATGIAAAQRTVTPDPATRTFLLYLFTIPSVVFALAGLSTLIVGSVRWAMWGRDASGVPGLGADPEVLRLLRAIADRLLLSDTAKRIAYRSHDLNALRKAIREDIDRAEFDAALVLVQEMSQTFGYREEAEAFREQIMAARASDMDKKVHESIARLEDVLARHDFERAAQEAAKMQRLYPDSEEVRGLSARVAQAREQYKHQLEREFLAAAERDDVDRAMDLLKELDKYLTEREAAPFREVARGVIGKKRDNLGVQFKIAVHDREWTRAVNVGEQIIREFPNTRMADEVRGMLDLLRQRAADQRAAQTV